jgi:hypothetical protein
MATKVGQLHVGKGKRMYNKLSTAALIIPLNIIEPKTRS